jgi:hypothetical protein
MAILEGQFIFHQLDTSNKHEPNPCALTSFAGYLEACNGEGGAAQVKRVPSAKGPIQIQCIGR